MRGRVVPAIGSLLLCGMLWPAVTAAPAASQDLLTAPTVARSHGTAPAASPDDLTTRDLAHRVFVVTFAGRWPHRVGAGAAAYNLKHFGVRTPAEVVHTFRPGGVIYFANNISTVDQVRRLSTGLQRAAADEGYRLLIMTDQEGGRVSRLPGRAAQSQPSAASYAGNVPPARRDAEAVGAAMRRMGVLVDLAPVADVNTVGDAGIIGDRSFGSTAEVVSPMVAGQVRGYHDGGVATTLKHWPGHGSTRVDSHKSLPTLDLSVSRWKRVHVPPFTTGIAAGTDLVMVSHLAYPALDKTGRPASLSPILTRQWLRGRLGFRGVIITDSLTMGALADYGDSPQIALRAFRAGADLLRTPGAPRAAARGLMEAVAAGTLDRAALEQSVRRALDLQDKLGLVDGPAELGP